MRTRAERRKNDYNKAMRKKHIAEEVYGRDCYDNVHQYSDNKIHCSCPLCSSKTNRNGKENLKNLTHSEKVRIDSMNAREADI